MKYIAYYRVSTQSQGNTGLGLRAQQEMVKKYAAGTGGEIVDSVVEIESGTDTKRSGLAQAMEYCKKHRATLLIAKLDRLSRNAAFVFALRDSGVKFICVDMPEANHLTIGLLAVLAEEEARLISERTSNALQQIKEKIAKGEEHISKSGRVVTYLGTPENLTPEARRRGAAVMRAKADSNPDVIKIGSFIDSLLESGKSFDEITTILNEAGYTGVKGGALFCTQVRRIYKRYLRIYKESGRIKTLK